MSGSLAQVQVLFEFTGAHGGSLELLLCSPPGDRSCSK